MRKGATNGLVCRFTADGLLYLMHQGSKKLIDILLNHRPNIFSVDFDCINVVVGIDWRPDATVKLSKDLLQLQQFYRGRVVLVVVFE